MKRTVVIVASVLGASVLAYFVHDVVIRWLFPCDAIFSQTTSSLGAKIGLIERFDGSVVLGKRAIQELSERAELVALNLKTCCVVLEQGRRDPDQFRRCTSSADRFAAGLAEVSTDVERAREQPQSADARAKAVAALHSALPYSNELQQQVAAIGGTPATSKLPPATQPIASAAPIVAPTSNPTAMPTAASNEISNKPASYEQSAPAELLVGEVVTGRLGWNTGERNNYWRVQLPIGKYDVIYDAARADGAWSNIMSTIYWRTASGDGRLVSVNDIDSRIRTIANLDASASGFDGVLAIGNENNNILPYWIGIFPAGKEGIPVPFFESPPPAPALVLGTPVTVTLDGGMPEAYYQVDLGGSDYSVWAEFSLIGSQGNVIGTVATFGSRGELHNTSACTVNEIGTSGRCGARLSLVKPDKRFIRVRRGTNDAYAVVLRVDP